MRTRVKGEWLKTRLQLLYRLCYKCHYSHTDHFIFRAVIEWMFGMHDRNLQTELGAVVYFIRTPTRWFLHLAFSYLIMEMFKFFFRGQQDGHTSKNTCYISLEALFSPWNLCKGGREDQLHKVVFWPLHRCHIICTPPPPTLSVRELRESGFSSSPNIKSRPELIGIVLASMHMVLGYLSAAGNKAIKNTSCFKCYLKEEGITEDFKRRNSQSSRSKSETADFVAAWS